MFLCYTWLSLMGLTRVSAPIQRSYIFTEPEGGWVGRGAGCVYLLAWEKPEGEGGSHRAAVQRPVIRSTAPTSCLTQLATTLTHSA